MRTYVLLIVSIVGRGGPRPEVNNMAQTMDVAIGNIHLENSKTALRTKEEVRYRIAEIGIVPAIRVGSEDDALFVAEALAAAGIPIVEISTVFPGAFHAISHVAERLPEITVGAGNILNIETARRCLDEAVKMGAMASNEWPKADRGRSARKSSRVTGPPLVVPTEDDVRAVLAVMPSHQPASWRYQAMSYTAAWAGLRPQECVALEREDVDLPETGWGTARVATAWNGCGALWGKPSEDVGPVKTFYREVPLTPELVTVLHDWVARMGITTGPLFRTDNGKRPTQSNWNRALRRACASADVAPMSPYSLRHFRASIWVESKLALPIVANLLGHSLETLVKIYAHPVSRTRAEIEKLLGE